MNLRLRYSFEMVEAYLAQMMGDEASMNAHLDRAEKILLDIDLEQLNKQRGLFD
jgi:hypothetical protein